MAKVHWQDVSDKERREMVKEMAKLFGSATDERDLVQILYRLLTPSEIVMIGRRMQVAELLVNGWSYDDIRGKLGVGMATIRAADRWLEHAMRDYMNIRDEQRAEEKRRRREESFRETYREWSEFGSFDYFRRRNSLEFLLVNLLLDSSPSPRPKNKKTGKKKQKRS